MPSTVVDTEKVVSRRAAGDCLMDLGTEMGINTEVCF